MSYQYSGVMCRSAQFCPVGSGLWAWKKKEWTRGKRRGTGDYALQGEGVLSVLFSAVYRLPGTW